MGGGESWGITSQKSKKLNILKVLWFLTAISNSNFILKFSAR